jgi:hypothetical protein
MSVNTRDKLMSLYRQCLAGEISLEEMNSEKRKLIAAEDWEDGMTWNEAFNILTNAGMPVPVAAHEMYFATRNPGMPRNGACYASCSNNAPWPVSVTARVAAYGKNWKTITYSVTIETKEEKIAA